MEQTSITVKHKFLVISDIHLGSDSCNSEKLLEVLKSESAENIIIDGDFFDSQHIHRLNKSQWKVLSMLRKLSKHSRVILIIGNHDYFESEILSNLLGFEVYDEYCVTVNDEKYIFIHGHIFDFIMAKYKGLAKLISELYYYLCKNKWIREKLNYMLHTKSHDMLGSSDQLKKCAIHYMKTKNCNWIICGHTHHAEIDLESHYLNSGTFCSLNPTYIVIDHSGTPHLIEL